MTFPFKAGSQLILVLLLTDGVETNAQHYYSRLTAQQADSFEVHRMDSKWRLSTDFVHFELDSLVAVDFGFINGQLRMESLSMKGKLNGWCYAYFPDGTTESMTMYSNGCKEGACYAFLPDGLLREVRSYSSSVLNEVITEVDSVYVQLTGDWLVTTRSTSCLTQRHGMWYYFDATGILNRTEKWSNGKLID